MKSRPVFSSLLVLIAAISHGSTDPVVVAKAEQLLKGADDKLAASQTLRAVYTETDEYPGEYQDLRQVGTLTLLRPSSYRLEIERARRVNASDPWKTSGNTTLVVSDGQKAYSAFFHAHSTQVRENSVADSPRLPEAPLLAGFFSGNHSPATALAEADSNGGLGDVEVNGPRVQFSAGDIQRTADIGDDGLIHRLIVLNRRTKVTKTWTLDSIALDKSILPSVFRYAVPSNSIPYPLAERSEGISAGVAAPDFLVQSPQDKPVRLSDFRGKVVVLEFWATWCWPCNQSIPETQRLVSKYSNQGAEGFLVSIKDNRKGFDAWVKKHPQYHDLHFAFDDPVHGQAYEAFLHPNNPTLFVIGRDGRVILKTQGYTGPNPEVEKAIKSAL